MEQQSLFVSLLPLILIGVGVVGYMLYQNYSQKKRQTSNSSQSSLSFTPVKQRVGMFIAAGIVVGAFIGFLLRPSVQLVGQLPFSAVITRGSELQGLDQILIPAARTSFNYLLVGGIVGAIAGFVATKLMTKK